MTEWKIGLAALASMTVACATPAAASASKNLILDGDGSAATCTGDWKAVATVPGWTVVQGDPTVNCSSIAQIDPPNGGSVPAAFIADGPWGDSALAQTVDIASAATAIGAGGVTFTLSGWLGGWAAYPGQAIVTAVFQDKDGKALGQPAVLNGVTAAARHNESRFLARKANGTVPVGARAVRITLRFVDTGETYNDGYATNLSFTLSTPVDVPALTPPEARVPQFDHVFMVMMENTNFGQVIGDTKDAPFINQLAAQGTLLANYTGVYHPSDENYLAIAGGNTFVQGAIYFPNIHITSPQIGDELEADGKTWRAYEQGMGKPCNLKNNYDYYYEPDDAPFINFTDVADNLRRCQAHLVDTKQLGLDLQTEAETPAFSWIAADDYYDGESSGNGSPKSLRTQDGWLEQTLTPIFNSPSWTKQRSLLVLTWDESDTYASNHVAAILVGSQGLVRQGVVSRSAFNHYSVARTIEAALGVQPFTNNDGYAPPINVAFQAGTVSGPQISLSSSSVAIGQSFGVAYSTPSATLSSTNWVGLYRPGQTPGDVASTVWQYAPSASGSLSFSTSSLSVGSWDVYYLYNDGYTILAGPLSLNVTSAAAAKASVLTGGCFGVGDARNTVALVAVPAHRRAGCGR
jgi:hypothetical protein